jgi:hypothetical protein
MTLDEMFCDSEQVAIDTMDKSCLQTGQAVLVGSRRIFRNMPVSTDYDYMMIDCTENRQLLESLGYEKSETNVHYLDEFTSAIYKKETTQVTLKYGQSWRPLNNFWNFLEANPKMFTRYVWKSSVDYPKDSDAIKDFIEDFVPKYAPYLE